MNLQDDRVLRFIDSCFDAGIKRPDLYILSKMPQTYGWLKGCFPRGILPTDVDGIVEISGHFLWLEFKHETALRGGAIPKGQRIALKSAVNTGKFTVLIIGTDDGGEPKCFEVWYPNGKLSALKDCTKEDIQTTCTNWSAWVQKQPA